MTFDPLLVWDEYTHLEDDFLKCLNYVPLIDEHFPVWSLYLGDLLLRTGSILDSFFRRAIYSPTLDDAIDIEKYRALDDNRINIETYRQIFDGYYNLSSKEIFDLRIYSSIIPFSSWSENKAPKWWEDYNQVKHDRFKNKKAASLKTTLDAIGGLFLINVLHKETIPILVDLEIIKGGLAKGYLKKLLAYKEPMEPVDDLFLSTVYAKSRLFGYVFESKKFTIDDRRKKEILSPSYPGY
jgi:hypothetical protein